jgi:hypothetical protein
MTTAGWLAGNAVVRKSGLEDPSSRKPVSYGRLPPCHLVVPLRELRQHHFHKTATGVLLPQGRLLEAYGVHPRAAPVHEPHLPYRI